MVDLQLVHMLRPMVRPMVRPVPPIHPPSPAPTTGGREHRRRGRPERHHPRDANLLPCSDLPVLFGRRLHLGAGATRDGGAAGQPAGGHAGAAWHERHARRPPAAGRQLTPRSPRALPAQAVHFLVGFFSKRGQYGIVVRRPGRPVLAARRSWHPAPPSPALLPPRSCHPPCSLLDVRTSRPPPRWTRSRALQEAVHKLVDELTVLGLISIMLMLFSGSIGQTCGELLLGTLWAPPAHPPTHPPTHPLRVRPTCGLLDPSGLLECQPLSAWRPAAECPGARPGCSQ